MKKCIIQINDEVNCKLVGLDLAERKNLHNKFSYEIPGARYLPAVKLGRWNGKVSYFQLGGSTYINLLDEIIPYLDEVGYDIEVDDRREYLTKFNFSTVTENTFSHHLWPKGHPAEGKPILLRDYQVSIINGFLENPQSVVEASTGSGKTIVTAALSKIVEEYGRSIVIVPNKSLVVQTETDYINLGLDVGVFFGDRKEYGKTHTICTWQSLLSLLKNTKSGDTNISIEDFLNGVICVIVDEAHSCKGETLKSLLTGVMSHIPLRWGLTGTIPKEKFESTALLVSIGKVVKKISASELQDKGVLAQCHVNVIQLQDEVEFSNYQSELKFLLDNQERLDIIASLVKNIITSGNTLILVDRVAAGESLIQKIPGSVFVSGDTKIGERKQEYDEISVSSNKVIIATYGVASTGINLPRIFNVVLIEPGKSFIRTIQTIGRGLRKAHDKDHVEIWDITSSCRFSKRHLTKRKEFYKEANYNFTMEKLNYK